MKYTQVIWLPTLLLVSALYPSDACRLCPQTSAPAIATRFGIEMKKGIANHQPFSSRKEVHDLYRKTCDVHGFKKPAQIAGFNSIFADPKFTYAQLEGIWRKQAGKNAKAARELKALPNPMSFPQSREARRQASTIAMMPDLDEMSLPTTQPAPPAPPAQDPRQKRRDLILERVTRFEGITGDDGSSIMDYRVRDSLQAKARRYGTKGNGKAKARRYETYPSWFNTEADIEDYFNFIWQRAQRQNKKRLEKIKPE